MSTKTQMYSELAEKASKELTHSVNEWCMFLKSQAKLYKYPYADQLMIYAQRPDASLCLSFDDWTQTMNRYIHKGAKGIGLVDYSGDAPKMKYVFDISDTSERYNSRAINVLSKRTKENRVINIIIQIMCLNGKTVNHSDLIILPGSLKSFLNNITCRISDFMISDTVVPAY